MFKRVGLLAAVILVLTSVEGFSRASAPPPTVPALLRAAPLTGIDAAATNVCTLRDTGHFIEFGFSNISGSGENEFGEDLAKNTLTIYSNAQTSILGGNSSADAVGKAGFAVTPTATDGKPHVLSYRVDYTWYYIGHLYSHARIFGTPPDLFVSHAHATADSTLITGWKNIVGSDFDRHIVDNGYSAEATAYTDLKQDTYEFDKNGSGTSTWYPQLTDNQTYYFYLELYTLATASSKLFGDAQGTSDYEGVFPHSGYGATGLSVTLTILTPGWFWTVCPG